MGNNDKLYLSRNDSIYCGSAKKPRLPREKMIKPPSYVKGSPPPPAPPQINRKVTDLTKDGEHHYWNLFIDVVTFRWILTYFANRKAKNVAIRSILEIVSPKNRRQFRASLERENLKTLEMLLEGVRTSFELKDGLSKEELSVGNINRALESSRLACQVDQLLGYRFSEEDKGRLLKYLILKAKNLENFRTFINKMHIIQAKRPILTPFIQQEQSLIDEIDSLEGNLRNDFAAQTSVPEANWLIHLFLELIETTSVRNTQIIGDSVRAYRTDPYTQERISFHASPGTRESFSLLSEYHVRDREHPAVDIQITNPKTMETVSLTIPIPSTIDLNDLIKFLKTPSDFPKKTHPNLHEWNDDAEKQLLETIANFNDSPNCPKGYFVLQKAEMRSFLTHPSSPRKALKAAALGNVFLLEDGTLSLLPKKSPNPDVQRSVTLPEEFAKRVWSELGFFNKKASFSLQLPSIAKLTNTNIVMQHTKCMITPVIKTSASGDTRYLEMETCFAPEITTTFTQSQSRKTYYMIPQEKTNFEYIGEIYTSGLLERDLLLALAEFYKQNLH